MNRQYLVLIFWLVCPIVLFSQPKDRQEKFDLAKDKVLYTVGYAHLDTEWLWDYPMTIDQDIKNILEEDFYLLDKYPEYVFNFTGSRRYKMLKEYYPEAYQKVIKYVKDGRWHVSGSSVDEGEVNISSSESLIRQVLYGNHFFKKEFGVISQDIMLPDCFGYLANVPSIWHHCGLLGFSTKKLDALSASGIPFDIGIWNGPDGKGIIAALKATSYTSSIVPRLDQDSSWNARIEDNMNKYGFGFDYRYYGVGDQGGAPRENDVRHASESLRHNDRKFKVILASSDQMYKDITPEIRKKLPTYSGDLLLIQHSAGSLTSQTYMKRINRKNELLAQSAEGLAVVADWLGGSDYPFGKLNKSWELVLGSQFHDILPGTSIPKAYEYAWNDEFVAANGFAEVLKNSVGVVSSEMNTTGKGRSIVVYNSVALSRQDVVSAALEYDQLPQNIQVFGEKGKALPTQVTGSEGKTLKFVFLANVPSLGMVVFDVRESRQAPSSSLKVTSRSLENDYYMVNIADNGDILSVYDKKASRELLSKPASLEFLHEHPRAWPAWNMDWRDRQNPPIDHLDKNATISVLENGPVRVALEIKREGQNSFIKQVVSLSLAKLESMWK
jgi:alpha-mannosidase